MMHEIKTILPLDCLFSKYLLSFTSLLLPSSIVLSLKFLPSLPPSFEQLAFIEYLLGTGYYLLHYSHLTVPTTAPVGEASLAPVWPNVKLPTHCQCLVSPFGSSWWTPGEFHFLSLLQILQGLPIELNRNYLSKP